MSNEKLGAEQGRETLQAIAQEIVANLGSCDASSDLGFKVIWATLDRHFGTGPKQAEQAYHARGAGRETDEAKKARLHAVIYDPHGGAISSHWTVDRVVENVMTLLLREPGADTGTTQVDYSTWFCKAHQPIQSHPTGTCFVCNGLELARKAARGTTPPEGPWRGVEDMLNRIDRRMDDEMGFGDDTGTLRRILAQEFNAALAATQRAPVEQGRDELQELKLSSEGGRSGSSHPVTLLSSPSPASADHAREGALRELRASGWMVAVHNDYRQDGKLKTFWLFVRGGRAIKGEGDTDAEALTQVAALADGKEGALFLCRYRDSEGKECGTPIALNVDSYSGFTHTEGSGWLHWASPVRYGPQDSKAVFVKRADGKEGGE